MDSSPKFILCDSRNGLCPVCHERVEKLWQLVKSPTQLQAIACERCAES